VLVYLTKSQSRIGKTGALRGLIQPSLQGLSESNLHPRFQGCFQTNHLFDAILSPFCGMPNINEKSLTDGGSTGRGACGKLRKRLRMQREVCGAKGVI
jgi:hypothetical protein